MTKENNNLFIGQKIFRIKKLYSKAISDEIQELTVSKIGKKYFYTSELGDRYPINKDSFKYEDKMYTQSNFQIYIDKQNILDNDERLKLLLKLKTHFEYYGKSNTLNELREVVKILKI